MIRNLLPDERTPPKVGAAVAVLRVFFGVIFFANGAAKILPGPWSTPLGFLFDANAALAIVSEAAVSHPVGIYRDFLASLVGSWPTVSFGVGLIEAAVGALLLLGLATRIAALLGASFALHLQVMSLSGGHWMFQHALVWLPLLVVAWLERGEYAVDGLLRERRLRRGLRDDSR